MGNINVYTGPMKCGKSQQLINEAKRQIIAGKNVKMFKPLIDDRFATDSVVDRNGNKFSAINISNISELKDYDADVYMIDEFQFLKGNVEIIQQMATEGKKFFIAGLNLTAEKKPFGEMGNLLCCSDNIQLYTSICECCHSENAIYSYCMAEKKGDILIGDSQYMPVCSNCYEKLTYNKTKTYKCEVEKD